MQKKEQKRFDIMQKKEQNILMRLGNLFNKLTKGKNHDNK